MTIIDKILDCAPKELVLLASSPQCEDEVLNRLLTNPKMKDVWEKLRTAEVGMVDSEHGNNLEWLLLQTRTTEHKRSARTRPYEFNKTPIDLYRCICLIKEWYEDKTLPAKSVNDAAIGKVREHAENLISAITENGFDHIPFYTFDDYDNKTEIYLPDLINDYISTLTKPGRFFRYSPLTNKGGTKGAPSFYAVMLNRFMRHCYGRPLDSHVATIANTILSLTEETKPKALTKTSVQTYVREDKRKLSGKARKKSPKAKA